MVDEDGARITSGGTVESDEFVIVSAEVNFLDVERAEVGPLLDENGNEIRAGLLARSEAIEEHPDDETLIRERVPPGQAAGGNPDRLSRSLLNPTLGKQATVYFIHDLREVDRSGTVRAAFRAEDEEPYGDLFETTNVYAEQEFTIEGDDGDPGRTPGSNYTVTLSDHRPGARPATRSTCRPTARISGGPAGSGTSAIRSSTTALSGSTRVRRPATHAHSETAIGDDDPGTRTDETFLGKYSAETRTGSRAIFDFYEPDRLAGEPVGFNGTDQFVSRLTDCCTNPVEPGWYRLQMTLNGTTYDGEFAEFRSDSEYVYVCDCSSEAEARDTPGPPPNGTSTTTSGSVVTAANHET